MTDSPHATRVGRLLTRIEACHKAIGRAERLGRKPALLAELRSLRGDLKAAWIEMNEAIKEMTDGS